MHTSRPPQGWTQGQGETGEEEEAEEEEHGADKDGTIARGSDDARSLLMQRNMRRLAEEGLPPLHRARAAAQQAARRVGQPSRHLYLPRRQVVACTTSG